METGEVMEKIEFYTTDEIVRLTPYKNRRTLLQALHNNRNVMAQSYSKIKELKNTDLSQIWAARFKFGKRWLFKKDIINQILKGK